MQRNPEFTSETDIPHWMFSSLQVQNGSLTYIGRNVTSIPEVFQKLYGKTIEHLDLSYNNINKLNGLENFPKIKELILDNNDIGDDVLFPKLLTLKTLSLNNNKMSDLESLIKKIKCSFPNLTFLSLLGNIACPNQLSDISKDDDDYQRYRYYVIHYLSKLQFLDSASVTAEELKEAKVKGQFMKVKTPKKINTSELSSSTENLPPLPERIRPIGDHRGSFTVFKCRYNNRESEGNRFIVNTDL